MKIPVNIASGAAVKPLFIGHATLALALLSAAITPAPTQAAISNWQTGQVIAGTESITLSPGGNLSDWNTAARNLRSAQMEGLDLNGATFENTWLDSANLSKANLTGAWFNGSTLTSANLTDATITSVHFSGTRGFTKEQLYSTASYKRRNLSGIEMRADDLSGWGLNTWDLSSQNLTHADFNGASVSGANLANANLTGASFVGASSRWANFTSANLTGAYFFYADVGRANLSHANLTGAYLKGARFGLANLADATINGANFENTVFFGLSKQQIYSTASYKNKDLSGVRFGHENLAGWDFSDQNLTGASFKGCAVNDANLTNANITGVDFAATRPSGSNLTDGPEWGIFSGLRKEQIYSTASYKNKDLSGINFEHENLAGWDFSNQNLTGAEFHGGTVAGVNFANANLTRASFGDSIMAGANLTDAIIIHTHFSHYGNLEKQIYSTASYKSRDMSGVELAWNKLTGWDFSKQNLTGASFEGTTLTNFDFTGASLAGANFTGGKLVNAHLDLADLRNAKGLASGAIIDSSLRGTILADGTVDAFVLNDGETWRARPNSLAVTLDGAITLSSNSTIEITGCAVQQKAGAALTLTVPSTAHLIVRAGGSLTCDKLIIAPGGQLDGDGAINATIVPDSAIPATIHRTSAQNGLVP